MKRRVRRVLHILPYSVFTESIIKKDLKCLSGCRQLHWIIGTKNIRSVHINLDKEAYGLRFIESGQRSIYDYAAIVRKFLESDKVIIHSLYYDVHILKIMAHMPSFIKKKFVWIIWGGDINKAENQDMEKTRRRLIEHIPVFGCFCKADYELLCKEYQIQRAVVKKMIYPYVLYQGKPLYRKRARNVIILNSATPACRHKDALERLSMYKDRDMRVYCILSYPDNSRYVNEICSMGRKIFGDRFIPVTGFMDYGRYQELLADMDIAVFNHNRQQGGGNLNNLLYMGKKIYMSAENGFLDEYREDGFRMLEIGQIGDGSFFEPLPLEDMETNRRLMRLHMSDGYYRGLVEGLLEG